MEIKNNAIPYCYLLSSILMVSIAQIFLAKGVQDNTIQISIAELYAAQNIDIQTIISLLLKQLNQHKPIIIGFFCYVFSFIIWGKTLHYFALSKAYSFLSLSYIIVYVFSFYFLPQTDVQFKLNHIFGIILIIIGIIAVMHKEK